MFAELERYILKSKETAIILFAEVLDDTFDQTIATICKSAKISFFKVNDPDTAMNVRATCLTLQKAVIRTIRAYCRGYDIKFLSESIVCVFANGATLDHDELY